MKNISIIGSCNTRNLFNYDILSKNYDIKFYAFQINMWDMFSPSINLPQDIINKIPVENFYRRMINVDINKTALNDIANSESEIILFDFYSIIRPYLLIEYNNNSAYMNNLLAYKINYTINNWDYKELKSTYLDPNTLDADKVKTD